MIINVSGNSGGGNSPLCLMQLKTGGKAFTGE